MGIQRRYSCGKMFEDCISPLMKIQSQSRILNVKFERLFNNMSLLLFDLISLMALKLKRICYCTSRDTRLKIGRLAENYLLSMRTNFPSKVMCI